MRPSFSITTDITDNIAFLGSHRSRKSCSIKGVVMRSNRNVPCDCAMAMGRNNLIKQGACGPLEVRAFVSRTMDKTTKSRTGIVVSARRGQQIIQPYYQYILRPNYETTNRVAVQLTQTSVANSDTATFLGQGCPVRTPNIRTAAGSLSDLSVVWL